MEAYKNVLNHLISVGVRSRQVSYRDYVKNKT